MAKSYAMMRKPPTSVVATTPSDVGWAAYDHQAFGAGRGKTTIDLALVDGRNVMSLPRVGAGGYTKFTCHGHECSCRNMSVPLAPGCA